MIVATPLNSSGMQAQSPLTNNSLEPKNTMNVLKVHTRLQVYPQRAPYGLEFFLKPETQHPKPQPIPNLNPRVWAIPEDPAHWISRILTSLRPPSIAAPAPEVFAPEFFPDR